MLKGFEHITQDLTEADRRLIPFFIDGFQKHRGPHNAISSRKIIERLARKDIKITDTKIRKIVNYIRKNHLLIGLVADSSGYYVTTEPTLLQRCIESMIGRENEIRQARVSLQEDLKSVLRRRQTKFDFSDPAV